MNLAVDNDRSLDVVTMSENYCKSEVSDVILGSRLEPVLSALGKHRNINQL